MVVVFQAMFSWATIPQAWIQSGIDATKNLMTAHFPAGDLRDLLVEGVIAGVGNSLVFLPQILLLFFFIAMLEDTGYLARAAFLMDRLMSRVGLHGKSFIPLLSSYACAIPGIMATRTIDAPRARILTILVAPLMSCSARLPVYTVMITAFIPMTVLVGFHLGHTSLPLLTLPALIMFAMYMLGTVFAFGIAAIFNRTLLKGDPPSFLLEMPPYRLPSVRTVIYQMFERSLLFLKRAGTIILSISIVLWFLSSYPKQPAGALSSTQLRQSFAGDMGRIIEPIIKPLGFDWKMGIGIISSFAAREVFVSAMGTVYNVDDDTAKDDSKLSVAVGQRMHDDIDPRTGRHAFTPLVAVALMVYYVLAMQCISTVAVVRRETGGWKWPLFQIGYMTVLAWVVTFVVYQGRTIIGVRVEVTGNQEIESWTFSKSQASVLSPPPPSRSARGSTSTRAERAAAPAAASCGREPRADVAPRAQSNAACHTQRRCSGAACESPCAAEIIDYYCWGLTRRATNCLRCSGSKDTNFLRYAGKRRNPWRHFQRTMHLPPAKFPEMVAGGTSR